MNDKLMPAIKRLAGQPSFVVAVVLLAVAAVSLNAATQLMQLYFKKLPVELARPLDSLPQQLGHWVQVSKDKPLDKETQEVLATDKYIFRDYVNQDVVGADEVAKFNGKSRPDREAMVAKIQAAHPEAVLNASVTYFTGMVDTVAHIPDRCYVADGFQPSEYEVVKWPVRPAPDGQPKRDLEVRFINFEDQTGVSRITRSVGYFFQVNGEYESDPLVGVRARLQSLTEKHAYYAKVEVMTLLRDREQSAAMMKDFLSAALPEIEKCLPDWNRVKAQAVR
jgi:BarA-like signal transduction histidine kinase